MPSSRDPWLDNAKIMLVTIVVVGHALVVLPDDPLVEHTYDWIYYFHMPAFVLVTGYLSRRTTWQRRHLVGILTTLVVPYVIFEYLLMAFRVHVGGEPAFENLWLNPHWPMWYLIVLAIWRFATPVLNRHWAWIPASILISLASGWFSVELLDLNRVLGFLPFYVVGLYLSPLLERLRSPHSWVGGIAVLTGLWWLAGRTDDWIGTQWLYYRDAYADLHTSTGDGVLLRGTLLALSFLAALAVLTLIPRGRSWFSELGKHTMIVYLFHGFFVRGAEYAGYGGLLPSVGWMLLLTAVLSVAVSLALASPPVARALTWTVDPVNAFGRQRRRWQDASTRRAGGVRRTADGRPRRSSDDPPSATPEQPGHGPRR